MTKNSEQPKDQPSQKKPAQSEAGKNRSPSKSNRRKSPKWDISQFVVAPQEGKSRFHDFDLPAELMQGIHKIGFEYCTPIQAASLPHTLHGYDLVGKAQTGTGKTAAFLLPLLHRLITSPHQASDINAMIIVPTRELAIQIAESIEGLSYFTDVSAIAVYGGGDGNSFAIEKKALTSGVDIVVCTPGRMIAHLNMGYVKLNGLKYLVLDEADRMLDMGFNDDINKIITYLPKQRQNLLFSATMPTKMRALARNLLVNPVEINIAISKASENITQKAFVVYDAQKDAIIKDMLGSNRFKKVIVFCSKKQNEKILFLSHHFICCTIFGSTN